MTDCNCDQKGKEPHWHVGDCPKLLRHKIAALEAELAGLQVENVRLRSALIGNTHQEMRTDYHEKGHRCSWRVAYEAVNQRSKAALAGEG